MPGRTRGLAPAALETRAGKCGAPHRQYAGNSARNAAFSECGRACRRRQEGNHEALCSADVGTGLVGCIDCRRSVAFAARQPCGGIGKRARAGSHRPVAGARQCGGHHRHSRPARRYGAQLRISDCGLRIAGTAQIRNPFTRPGPSGGNTAPGARWAGCASPARASALRSTA